jgi:hypothetical protein
MIQQEIPLRDIRLDAPENQMACESRSGCSSSGLTTMVRLCRTCRDHGIGTLLQGVSDKKLELSRLVSAKRQACQVIPLHPYARSAERFLQMPKSFERRRELSKGSPGNLMKVHVTGSDVVQFIEGSAGINANQPDRRIWSWT